VRLRRRPLPDLSALRRRFKAVVLLSVVVGIVTGLIVAGVHELIVELTWGHLAGRGDWWIALLPVAGLLGSTAIILRTRDRSTETTEDYIRVFHDPRARVRLRSVPLRLAASLSTIGLGGSMGLEGPSIFAGSAVGDAIERRFIRFIGDDDRKVLLVAGAAAGIAAIFKAPVTGIVFALEVPYRDDLARRALIPAMIAAASSYVVFVSLLGTTPLFGVAAAPLRLVDLWGSLLVGVACGLAARVFIVTYRTAARAMRKVSVWARALIGASITALSGVASIAAFHRPFALGPGYEPILRAARGQIGPWLLLALLGMKIVATTSTATGNGVGGLFFPSVLMGATVGGIVGHVVPGPASLFAVVGIAAFLGGSYKVPLAGVAFVAEATGAPGYIIPGLIAAALAYLASGRSSLSHRQRFRRVVDIDTRLDVIVADVMAREWVEVPAQATVQEFATQYVVRAKSRVMPIVEDGRYAGMLSLSAIAEVSPERWNAVRVGEVMRRDAPTLTMGQSLRDALSVMRGAGLERAAVVNRDGGIVGMLQSSDILQLEQILDTVSEERGRGLEP
jgi:chloride channel protein, CIC family